MRQVRWVRRVWCGAQVRRVRRCGLLVLALTLAGCADDPNPQPVTTTSAPKDAQHQGITTPHGDHSPHHGGVVLMDGDLHYEVVLDRGGRHQIWFSNAVRDDLPASVARDVKMTVSRPQDPVESVVLEIDDAGESWIARGRPVSGDNVMVKVSYSVQGRPHEIEMPFLPSSPDG